MTVPGTRPWQSRLSVIEILPTSFVFAAMLHWVRVSGGVCDPSYVDGATGSSFPATFSCRAGHLRLPNSKFLPRQLRRVTPGFRARLKILFS